MNSQMSTQTLQQKSQLYHLLFKVRKVPIMKFRQVVVLPILLLFQSYKKFVKQIIQSKSILFFSDVHCELSLNNHLAYQTSALLKDYVQIDPRVKTLLISLRFWVSIQFTGLQKQGLQAQIPTQYLIPYYAPVSYLKWSR